MRNRVGTERGQVMCNRVGTEKYQIMRNRSLVCLLMLVLLFGGVPAWGAKKSPTTVGKEVVVPVGVSLPITGPIASHGISCARSLEMAIEKVNAKGVKVANTVYKLKLIIDDDGYAAEKAVTVVNKQLYTDKVKILFTFGTTPNKAVMPILDAEKVLHFSHGTPPDIVSSKHARSFRLIQTAFEYAGPFVEWVAKNRPAIKKVFMVYPDESSQIAIAKAHKVALNYYRIELIGEETHPRAQTEYSPIIGKVLAAKPDAVITSGSGPAGNLVKQLREKGYTGLIWIYSSTDEAMSKLAGAALEGSLGINPEIESPLLPAAIKEYLHDYQAKYNAMPGTYAMDFYLKPFVLASAISKAGGVDVDRLVKVMESEELDSPWGKFRFGGEKIYGINHQAFFPAFVSEFRGGNYRTMMMIKPEKSLSSLKEIYGSKQLR